MLHLAALPLPTSTDPPVVAPGMAPDPPSPAPPPSTPPFPTEPVTTGERGRGERALMCAVLEDAVWCLRGHGSPAHERHALAVQARAWVESRDRWWPYSFERICDALGFEPFRLRDRLLHETAPAHGYGVVRRLR